MSGYTPSEEEVRGYITEHKFREFGERFDRFLADDRRKTAARALREAESDLAEMEHPNLTVVVGDPDDDETWESIPVTDWLRARANEIEKGASDDQS